MKERKQIEHDDCVICQAGTPHEVHKLADLKDVRDHLIGDYDQQELRVVADLMDRFNLARVELVPGGTPLWRPITPTTKLLINGVDIGITLGAGQGIEKTIREALKKGKL